MTLSLGSSSPVSDKVLNEVEAESLKTLGRDVFNTNGRAYLLQVAAERMGNVKQVRAVAWGRLAYRLEYPCHGCEGPSCNR